MDLGGPEVVIGSTFVYYSLFVISTSGFPADFRWIGAQWVVATHTIEQSGIDVGILLIGRS